jgi:hypothetical protein
MFSSIICRMRAGALPVSSRNIDAIWSAASCPLDPTSDVHFSMRSYDVAGCGVRKYDLAANKLDPDGERVYAPHTAMRSFL